ncbi:MAG TPA: FGGY-family carbohydrate kinase [Opitutus sp.]|nr:FGGY-family carbohydrate kinase [Opitutus sp.]
MSLFLGIDLGTSYFKIGLFDHDGALRGLGRVAVEPVCRAEGRYELATTAFWRKVRDGLASALAEAGASAAAIRGISYSSQANTFLLLDNRGAEITPLIFWHDQRARPLGAEIVAFGNTPEHARKTGLTGIAPEGAPSKCRWFAETERAIWAKAKRVMTISDYFTWCLTGELYGDAGTAALTGLYDLAARSWWPEALHVFGIDSAQLSKPLLPGSSCGKTTTRASEFLGIPQDTPFAVGSLDHHAAAIGSGIGSFADASLSTGTVLAALVLAPDILPAVSRIHGPHMNGGGYYRLAFDPNGAGELEEYQRHHAPALTLDQLVEEGDCAGSSQHGAAVRRILDRIVTTQRDLLAGLSVGDAPTAIAATGGGSRSPLLLQMQANALGATVVTSHGSERACLGAATFAAVAAGEYESLPLATAAMVHRAKEYIPAL